MIKTLIKALPFENGELYTVKDGRKVLLANCSVKLEVYSHEMSIPILGAKKGTKAYHAVIAVCGDMDFTRRIDAEYISGVERFEITADIQRKDGVFERMNFSRLDVNDIDLLGEWRFDVCCSEDIIRRLMQL